MQLTKAHAAALQDILTWRRDVRHFRSDPIAPDRIARLRAAMDLAPSVGNARPWRVMQVDTPATRAAVIANFERANAAAARAYTDDRRRAYDALKLAGLREAPVHLAVFTADNPDEGHGLGRQTMPEMLSFSTVCAIHSLWLAARADNIGTGWVSILDPVALQATLAAPPHWQLTAYLCLGLPARSDDTPLLHRTDWQENTATPWQVV
ncbi:cob(II)yrinic acid a,c-diamide reductase [Loktanella sp. 3ANDIMAR09]|uniref:5,6-dimethylbenzimidazole synthase n=1 Tax=Loktanella sp. 3ANDIMAR09 TaxID=1225657 RepID=UPI0006F4FD5F|nr:5,6-dimethylbenzimidazole synthase [Loktanella sp. 3ANDIMAR09]KQI68212.1 cob(II)yrinic acid a,c-diamide reductase [Loktanella sp. 3ANDIMAR09]